MNVTSNATSAPAKPPTATQSGIQVSANHLLDVSVTFYIFKIKHRLCVINVLLLSLAVPGVFRGEEPAVERASESPLRSKRAALQSQRCVRLGPAAGVHIELGACSHLPDRRRLEVGRSGELPPSPDNLRGYYVRLAVRSSVCGGPTWSCFQPHQEVLVTFDMWNSAWFWFAKSAIVLYFAPVTDIAAQWICPRIKRIFFFLFSLINNYD